MVSLNRINAKRIVKMCLEHKLLYFVMFFFPCLITPFRYKTTAPESAVVLLVEEIYLRVGYPALPDYGQGIIGLNSGLGYFRPVPDTAKFEAPWGFAVEVIDNVKPVYFNLEIMRLSV